MSRGIGFRALAVMMTLVAACASGGASSSNPTKGSSRTVITSDEIPTSGAESAYDLIQRLRPEYLRVRPAQGGSFSTGVGDAPPPAVVVNGQRVGDLSDLRRIPAVSLSEVRYYNLEEAKRKFGMQYAGGAIELTYRQR